MAIDTITWRGGDDGFLRLIDQTRLPAELVYLDCADPGQVWNAIRRLSVRGAPAIGVAAAYGAYLGVRDVETDDPARLASELARVADYLASSRPTAVNLFWALERMKGTLAGLEAESVPERKSRLLEEARRIHEEDRETCRKLGEIGAALVENGDTLLTHCNAGGLATSDYGTALAVFYRAHEQGKRIHVFADETRPLLQGARLTAWELQRQGIEVTLICDNMAGSLLRRGAIRAIFVGADRIAANGDTANKIGTYPLAVLARENGVPFYVVAPTSTFDLALDSGDGIPIEERAPEEVTEGFGPRTAPPDVRVYNPAFDVTPARYISGIVTEKGLIRDPNRERIREVLAPRTR
jgi:methylthioribose-1-phosphate isomerase